MIENPLNAMFAAVRKHLESAVEIAALHRKAHGEHLHEIYLRNVHTGRGDTFFRDFCTVHIRLPQRSGLSTIASNFLTSEDLLITRCPTGDSKAPTYREFSDELFYLKFIPRYIVVDTPSYYSMERVYKTLGKDPDKQTFILLS